MDKYDNITNVNDIANEILRRTKKNPSTPNIPLNTNSILLTYFLI